MKSAALVILMLIAVSAASFAEVQTKAARIGTTTVHYKVVLPKGYDPAITYPAVLAFGGGAQTMATVDLTLQRNWLNEAETRGYIVILPAAPDDILFFQGGDKIFPEFIVTMLNNYKIQDNKFHAAGYSNGGTTAFLIAASYPQYFLSITAFPGYLLRDSVTNLHNISKLCINMYVGELDSSFLDLMRKQSDLFRESGLAVKFSIEKGQGHILGTLGGGGSARLFNNFDEARQGCESHTEHQKSASD
jgi:predicted peptidase